MGRSFKGLGELPRPAIVAIRKDMRVKEFLKQAKYLDHLRAQSWPENYRAPGRDDFDCR